MADEPRRVRTQAERAGDDHTWRAVAEEAVAEETDRIAIAAALIRSGVYDDEADLLQWRLCATCPSKGGPCACAGAPYVSDEVWQEMGPVIAAIRDATEERAWHRGFDHARRQPAPLRRRWWHRLTRRAL